MDDDEIKPVEKKEDDQNAIQQDELPSSARGAPEKMKAAIRKKQNAESAKRSRARRKEQYQKMFEKFHEQTRQIAELEERVSTLVSIISDAGITLPPTLENVNDVRNFAKEADDSPDDEQLFKEMMRILDGDDLEPDEKQTE